eukprot:CAMPEP_0181320590 /NCGR_PEP_ID=MMETSP1101-20121128/18209_1 /TAXON_ID=46948 /ORGANISM="Rhodomonas abbreviata, Strain Caron Lab Isolate" /LENGTH=169 /DNA_ID=CAMNT_0023428313 /DNA_START=250 /DNA_END=755 /DNA_ORIENTATION=-
MGRTAVRRQEDPIGAEAGRAAEAMDGEVAGTREGTGGKTGDVPLQEAEAGANVIDLIALLVGAPVPPQKPTKPRPQEAEAKLIEEETARRVEQEVQKRVRAALESDAFLHSLQTRMDAERKALTDKMLAEVAREVEEEKKKQLEKALAELPPPDIAAHTAAPPPPTPPP